MRTSGRVVLTISAVALAVSSLGVALPAGAAGATHEPVCPGPAAAGSVRCFAQVDLHQVAGRAVPLASSAPTGLTPTDIKRAYGFPTGSTAGAGTTIAIVDAYDDPNAESDLAVFSAQFDLPACTTANGCFSKVDQSGGASYPRKDPGWALEISLDVQWAHAIAPGAKILLVEANSANFTDLLAAEDYAGAHAGYVSNSWGGSESSNESSYDSHFAIPGVSYFVSSGDSGTPAQYPSASPNVISVGGTSLNTSSWVETGWSGSGGGCSAYEKANLAQKTNAGGSAVDCGGMRATPDVALDADPSSGVSVYDSTKYQGQSGWFTVGGTSASSPMWAARSAVAGAQVDAAYVYGSNLTYNDILSGNNGEPAGVGYDLVTGLGSWLDANGLVTNGSTSGGGGTGGGTGVVAHVRSIGPYTSATHGNAMLIPVTVVDGNGNPLSGAAVTVSITGPVSASASGTTASNGTVTFRVNHAPAGRYVTTATNVTGYTWDQDQTSYTGCYATTTC